MSEEMLHPRSHGGLSASHHPAAPSVGVWSLLGHSTAPGDLLGIPRQLGASHPDAAARDAGLEACWSGPPQMGQLWFAPRPPLSYREAMRFVAASPFFTWAESGCFFSFQ